LATARNVLNIKIIEFLTCKDWQCS